MENNEIFEEVFDSGFEVNLEMDEVNPWMMIASESGTASSVA